MFSGSIVALLTPFKNGKVDEKAFQSFVDWQINQGTNGLVPVGTTGKSPTLSHEEHMRVVELCIEAAAGRVPVMAGAGSNSTDEAIALTRLAKQAGADAVLSVTPYYNKPTQEGLYQHYKAIHDAAEIPIFIYNIPGRSVVDMSVATMARLAKLPNIVGVKDATADLTRPLKTRRRNRSRVLPVERRRCDRRRFPCPGWTRLHHGHRQCGASPERSTACGLAAKDWATVERLRDQLMPLHHAMFLEASPAPVKYAASLLGLCSEETRLPIVPVTEPTRVAIREAMVKAGVLN